MEIVAALNESKLGQSILRGRWEPAAMHAKLLITLVSFSFAAIAVAQESPAQFNTATTLRSWSNPKWDAPVEQKVAPLRLGKSDFAVTGPLVDTFRLKPNPDEERSIGRKILDLPIVNMFVPEPWPKPSRQGKYFAWGEREVPWATTAERQRSGPGGVLVSVSR
jgi:hypothetical protein